MSEENMVDRMNLLIEEWREIVTSGLESDAVCDALTVCADSLETIVLDYIGDE